MTAEVVNLKGALQKAPVPPNEKVVGQLEVVLDRARKGYIQGVILVTDELDGSTGTMSMGDPSYAMVGRLNEMIRDALAFLDEP